MVARMAIWEQDVARWTRAGMLAILLGLSLAACRDRASVANGVPPASPPAVQGPVNPDPGVTRYACADGQTVTAGYPDRETAVVTYKDHAYTLKLVRSVDGARYTGYGLQWWTQGDRASLAELKGGEEAASAPGLDCHAPPKAPAGDSVTRTSFIGDR
jgi:membrane-bound inhibitor of C-type lysozyme